jgi:hypothetical protein
MQTLSMFLFCTFLSTATICSAMSMSVSYDGNGEPASRIVEIEDFNTISVSGIMSVDLICGESSKAEIFADSNLLEHIILDVNNGQLDVYSDSNINPKSDMRIVIQTPVLNAIEISGAADIKVSSLNCDNLRVEASGASSVNLAGKTENLELRLSGASDVLAKDLESGCACVRMSGASGASIDVIHNLNAELSGASDLDYWGRPVIIEFETSGVASVKQHEASRPVQKEIY